jgi:hypothetical protein
MSLADWCDEYGISAEVRRGLEVLGFEPGDDLDDLTPQDWHDAGLGILARHRVISRNREYRRHLKGKGRE